MSVLETLTTIIRMDTTNPPGDEALLADWISEYLKPYGFVVEMPECGENRRSVVARLSMGEGPKLVLNGHLDVVPAGEGWDTNPFVPAIRNARVYGRGSADMKGGVAAMIEAGIAIAGQQRELCGELCLVFVADEEIINLGAHSCRPWWKDADYVVIGEPTQMQIAIAHKGTARFEITVSGKSCHSGTPWDGINAVEKMAVILKAIQQYDDALKHRTHPLLSRPSVSATMIKGGEKDNIIPGVCSLWLDYRMIPGDTGDRVEMELKKFIDQAACHDPEFSYSIHRYINLEPGEISAEHELVKTAEQVFAETFARRTGVRDFPATCEQVLFTREGIPAIVIGPGSIRQAHVANEFVEISQLEEAALFYEALARRLLGRKS